MNETAGIHIWLLLWKATRTVESHALRSVESFGLCGSDFGVLEALLHKGPLQVSALGEKVLLTSGSITTAVDRLENRGLVKRRATEDDRRARIVQLTASGRRLIRELFGKHQRDLEGAVAGLNTEERKALTGLLRKLGHSAAEAVEQPRHKKGKQ